MEKDKTPQAKANEPESLEGTDTPPTGAADKQTEQSPASKPSADSKQPSDTQNSQEKESFIKRIMNFSMLYLVAFVLLVIIGALAVLILSKQSKKNPTNSTSASSLTSGQIAQIQGNTTLVGDAKQTLDLQGNTIFEGQGLFRNNLAVASGVQVGGTISAQSINVGGTGNFSQLQVSQNLSVNGDFSVSGQLTIQKGLTVSGNGSFSGNLTVAQLSAQIIQINGDFNVSHHIVTNGSIPGKVGGTALGNGGTASVSGSDTAGTIDINIGSAAPAGNLVTISFSAKFAKIPHVVITPVGSGAAGLQYYVTRSVSGFTVATANAPTAGSTFSFDYIVVD